MIFHRHHLGLIARGMKVETRRVVKPGETKPYYREGGVYTLQPGRGMHGVGIKVKVTAIEQQWIWAVTTQDAHAEGYKTREEYLNEFTLINARRKVKVEAGATFHYEVPAEEKRRIGGLKVWAIRFKVAEVNLLEVDDGLLEVLLWHPRWAELTNRQMRTMHADEFNWVHARVSAIDRAGLHAQSAGYRRAIRPRPLPSIQAIPVNDPTGGKG